MVIFLDKETGNDGGGDKRGGDHNNDGGAADNWVGYHGSYCNFDKSCSGHKKLADVDSGKSWKEKRKGREKGKRRKRAVTLISALVSYCPLQSSTPDPSYIRPLGSLLSRLLNQL